VCATNDEATCSESPGLHEDEASLSSFYFTFEHNVAHEEETHGQRYTINVSIQRESCHEKERLGEAHQSNVGVRHSTSSTCLGPV
jgi:hypothetical protein